MGLKSLTQKHSSESGSKVPTTNVCVIVGKLKYHHCLLTQEKLESGGAQLERVPYKTLQHFAQEMGISLEYPRITTKLLKL